jgi:hypothetical protein
MPTPSADFVLPSSIPDERLLAVAADSGLALCSGVGVVGDLISLVKAKELAQAALAQAQALIAKRAEEESTQAAEAARDATNSASVAAIETSLPASCLVHTDGQSVPVIPKPKRVAKKSAAVSSTPAPRLLRKTPARQARASAIVSK